MLSVWELCALTKQGDKRKGLREHLGWFGPPPHT